MAEWPVWLVTLVPFLSPGSTYSVLSIMPSDSESSSSLSSVGECFLPGDKAVAWILSRDGLGGGPWHGSAVLYLIMCEVLL